MANDATPTRTLQPALDAANANLERARQRLTTMLTAARLAANARAEKAAPKYVSGRDASVKR